MNIMDTRLQERLKSLTDGQPQAADYRPSVNGAWNGEARKSANRSPLLLAGAGLLVVAVAGLAVLVYSGRQLSVRLQLAPAGTTAPAAAPVHAVSAALADHPASSAASSTSPTAAEEKAALARLSAALVQRKQATLPPPTATKPPAAPAKANQVVTLMAVQHVPIAATPPASTPTASPVTATAAPPAVSEADAMKLAHRASDLIQQGQIAGARVLLERAEGAHDPKIDFALAETYDPNQLSLWKVLGLVADPVRARNLYQLAAKGGITEAKARIAALPAP